MSKDMTGSISKNKKKEKDSHPDYRGSCTINGVQYWISSWVNEGSDGKYLSLKFQQKDEAPRQSALSDDDDIPF
jgi:hypothetical protein